MSDSFEPEINDIGGPQTPKDTNDDEGKSSTVMTIGLAICALFVLFFLAEGFGEVELEYGTDWDGTFFKDRSVFCNLFESSNECLPAMGRRLNSFMYASFFGVGVFFFGREVLKGS
jgi:hypothetical protein